ncbi:MAG: branched chain amino acid aminotransferase [marine bacterium B5-7]|nr:MAG: branched chain amino acid aminotransferase [marine bacterium B5-7]
MRAFENRSDCVVWDEPFYGPYLHLTGKTHPGAAEVIADQGYNWREVVRRIEGSIPESASLWYQKHMTHHMLDDISLDFMDTLANCFLIRDPVEVLSSYRQRRESFDASDLGFKRQFELFEYVRSRSGEVPPVLDSADVLKDPRGMLNALCAHLGIEFSPAMLNWPAGARDSDGVWSKYWYDAVKRSTGFMPYKPHTIDLDEDARLITDAGRDYYDMLYAHRLMPLH